MKKKAILTVILIILLAAFIAGCGTKKNADQSDHTKKTSGSDSSYQGPEISEEAAEAYLDLLQKNKASITRAARSAQYSDSEAAQQPVALYDLDGDDTPELFYLTYDRAFNGRLHSATVSEGAAVENSYTCTMNGEVCDGFRFSQKDGDHAFVVFQNRDEDKLYLYHSTTRGASSRYNCSIYSVGEGAVLQEEDVYCDVYNAETKEDRYSKNGETMSNARGARMFSTIFRSVRNVILCSGEDETSIWDHITDDNTAACSYTDMVDGLEQAAGDD